MALLQLVIFLIWMLLLIKSADYATRYASRLAKSFHLSEFIISFFIVAVISVMPETAISIMSAIDKIPVIGMATLLGSNVADLSLVFGIVALVSQKGLKVKSEILKEKGFYIILLLLPVLLGFDGRYSRIDGTILISAGLFFFYRLSVDGKMFSHMNAHETGKGIRHNFLLLAASLAALLVCAHYAIKSGVAFAELINIPPVIISLTIISIGTCLPELLFSLRSARTRHDELALGDILGTVVTDATIILGIVILIQPFSFDMRMVYVTGVAMFLAGVLAVIFMETGKVLSKREGLMLLAYYAAFIAVEIALNFAG
jgi:cation:H+ antiporter